MFTSFPLKAIRETLHDNTNANQAQLAMSHYFVRTYRRRKRFLDELAVGSSVSRAAMAAQGTPAQFKRWRAADPDFAKDWDEAIEEGTDILEDIATERAMVKSDPLMIMMLKARRPEKYDRAGKMDVGVTVNVEGAKQKLLNRIARLQAERGVPLLTGGEELGEAGDDSEAEGEAQALPPTPNPTDVLRRKRGTATQRGDRRQATS